MCECVRACGVQAGDTSVPRPVEHLRSASPGNGRGTAAGRGVCREDGGVPHTASGNLRSYRSIRRSNPGSHGRGGRCQPTITPEAFSALLCPFAPCPVPRLPPRHKASLLLQGCPMIKHALWIGHGVTLPISMASLVWQQMTSVAIPSPTGGLMYFPLKTQRTINITNSYASLS